MVIREDGVMLAIADISKGLGGLLVAQEGHADPDRCFPRVAIDSRNVQAGDLFIALPGNRHDGHDYVGDAISLGALGAIVSRPIGDLPEKISIFQVSNTLLALQQISSHWRSQHQVRIVGVTGSVGKTTCKELIASVLEKRQPTLRSEANYNTEIGLPLTLLQLTSKQRWAVLEMAMYEAGEIARLCEIARPQIGVITNIDSVHLERLGSIEAIAGAKAELLEKLPSDGLALLNGDDPWTEWLSRYSSAPILLYGSGEHCQLRATEIASHGLEGISFRFGYGDDQAFVAMQTPGVHHVYPALAAAGVALAEGFTFQETAAALATANPTLRLQIRAGVNGSTILDDSYNAGPSSMIAALDLLSVMNGRRLALLGDMLELGSATNEEHQRLGVAAAGRCDVLFLVGEMSSLVAATARQAGLTKIERFSSNEEAAESLASQLKAGDHLLVKASRALKLETVVEALSAS